MIADSALQTLRVAPIDPPGEPFGGELARALRSRDKERAIAIAREYQGIFGKENYFIEIMKKPEIEGHDEVERALIELARELDIPIVGTQDSHYLFEDVVEVVLYGVREANQLSLIGSQIFFHPVVQLLFGMDLTI